MPPEYEVADVVAMQALAGGTADEDQQKRVLEWLISKCCRTHDFPFMPSGDRETCLMLGRQFSGQQIVKLLHLNPAALTGKRGTTEQG